VNRKDAEKIISLFGRKGWGLSLVRYGLGAHNFVESPKELMDASPSRTFYVLPIAQRSADAKGDIPEPVIQVPDTGGVGFVSDWRNKVLPGESMYFWGILFIDVGIDSFVDLIGWKNTRIYFAPFLRALETLQGVLVPLAENKAPIATSGKKPHGLTFRNVSGGFRCNQTNDFTKRPETYRRSHSALIA